MRIPAFCTATVTMNEVHERDLTSFVIVELTEGHQYFILGIAMQGFVRHIVQELLIHESTAAFEIDIEYHLQNLTSPGLELQGMHGRLQLPEVATPRSISIEEVEGLFESMLLTLSQLHLILTTSSERISAMAKGEIATALFAAAAAASERQDVQDLGALRFQNI